jgi:hypothetical protein
MAVQGAVMRTSLSLFAFLVLFVAGCSNGAADSGSTDSGLGDGVTAGALGQSDCLLSLAAPHSTLVATDMGGGTVHVDHDGWEGNCCTDVAITLEVAPPVVSVTYVETGEKCFCTCPFNLDYDLFGLASGEWTIDAAGDSTTVKVGV